MENLIKIVNESTGQVVEFTPERYVGLLNSRVLVKETGKKYQVTVRQISNWTDPEGRERLIVNLQAKTQYHHDMSLKLTKEGDYQKAINQHLTVTLFKQPNGGWNMYAPKSGEVVNIILGEIVNKQGEKMLTVTSMTEIANASATKTNISVNDLFADELSEIKEAEKEFTKVQ